MAAQDDLRRGYCFYVSVSRSVRVLGCFRVRELLHLMRWLSICLRVQDDFGSDASLSNDI